MPEPLKNLFFTPESLNKLANAIKDVYRAFDAGKFLELIYASGWEARELKDRMHHTAACLAATLPAEYDAALAILERVVPHIQGFDAMVFPDFVETYGRDDWERSMPALAFFTQFASSEFAVRPFLDEDSSRAMAYLYQWAEDPNPHVRRLASEGCRPRLPWAMALSQFKADPSPILPVLERLKDDESDFVRRSVANNLNDISKDHPDLMLDICERWYGQSERTDWIVKHACRSLLKAGNRRAMALFGFDVPENIAVKRLRLEPPALQIGQTLIFSFDLHVIGEGEQRVRVEYAIDYVRASGDRNRKVFHFSERIYIPGIYFLRKQQPMADLTTRRHYPGEHCLAIIVNGRELASTKFELYDQA
ncbi:MAG: DNA alkylation repair protein [Caldilineaceae bacterium]|nr:DNA alkylation repair protein [Caldilineaceae bacterium]